EQLRRAVAQRPIVAAGHEIAATVSVGAARPDERHQCADELIDAADQALYVAKRRGRNRVCLAADVTRDDLAAQQPEVVRLAQATARSREVVGRARAMALAVSVRPSARADPEEPHAEQVAELAARIAGHLGLP